VRSLGPRRKFCFAAARQRLAEWSAEQLERQVTPGAEQVIQKYPEIPG